MLSSSAAPRRGYLRVGSVCEGSDPATFGSVIIDSEACITEEPRSDGGTDIRGSATSKYNAFPQTRDSLEHSVYNYLIQGDFVIKDQEFVTESSTSLWATANTFYADIQTPADFYSIGDHTFEVDLNGTIEIQSSSVMARVPDPEI